MTTLVSKNLMIGKRRTSSRLEPSMWQAFTDIAEREGLSIHSLATRIDERRGRSSLTSSIRIFILMYFRVRVQAVEDLPRRRGEVPWGSNFLEDVLDRCFGPLQASDAGEE